MPDLSRALGNKALAHLELTQIKQMDSYSVVIGNLDHSLWKFSSD